MDSLFIQDPPHIGTKMRQRILRVDGFLPMGIFFVLISHVKEIMDKYPKSEHCLTDNDLSPTDKMNFKSVQKLIHENVLNLLTIDPEHRATLQYLKILKCCLEPYLSKTLCVRERIYQIWYAIMFLRLWKTWIPLEGAYKICLHFITPQTHACIELNGHMLIIAALKFSGSPNFLPWLMSSQCCESLFRQLRSMGSTFSTVINMSMLDMLHKLKRLQIIETAPDQLDDFEFPRNSKKSNEPTFDENPEVSLDEIVKIVMDAKKKAIEDAAQLGMFVDINFEETNPINTLGTEEQEADIEHEPTENLPTTEDVEESTETFEELLDIDPDALQSIKSLSIRSHEEVPLDKQQIFVKLKFKDKVYTIRKSTLAWMFTKETQRVSTDRLMRFSK